MLSQRRAAEIWGVSRRTIQRAIQSGKLSVASNGQLDPSELLRVFGEADGKGRGGAGAPPREPLAPPDAPGAPPPSNADLEAEIRALRAALAAKEELLSAKEQHISDLSLSLRLLAAPSPHPEPSSQPKTPKPPAWRRWLGRA